MPAGLVQALPLAGFLAWMLVLAWIDARRQVLPNRWVYPGIALALAGGPWLPAGSWAAAGAGAGLCFAVLAAFYFWRPEALGAGDVKVAALIGAALGAPAALLGLTAALALAAAMGLALVAVRRWPRSRRVPLGPYLAAGSVLALLL